MSRPETGAVHGVPMNFNCPYHSKLLRIPVPQSNQDGIPHSITMDYSMLADMPPVGLTARCRLGTSKSCGCTCGAAIQDDMTRELDGMMIASNTRN
jgi:hypothetical protein